MGKSWKMSNHWWYQKQVLGQSAFGCETQTGHHEPARLPVPGWYHYRRPM